MKTKPAPETYGTTIETRYVGRQSEPSHTPGEKPWEHHAWEVTLTREGESITIPYRMGLAHEQTKCGKRKPNTVFDRFVAHPYATCGHQRCENAGWQPTPPTLYEVLCSFKADDPQGETFHDWCGNYGYDTDSRRAMETYLACQESEVRSRKFFGADWQRIIEDEDYQ